MATLPAAAAGELLRPGGGGRAHPARARSRAARCTRTCAGATARRRSPTRTRSLEDCLREDARRAAVPGAAHADGDRRGRLQPGRGRPAAPGDGLEAVQGAHGPHARPAAGRAWPSAGSPVATAEEIAKKLEAFANFGFPESHSVSFAYLVYSSAWIKLHYPAEFVCGLLNAQPMGFYSPHTLVRDARRHGVEVLGPVRRAVATRLHARAAQLGCRPRSGGRCRVGTPTRRSTRCASGSATCAGCRARCSTASTRSARVEPFRDLEDFTRRTGAPVDALESLATAGAFALLRGRPARRAVGRGRAARRAPPSGCRARHRDRGAAAAGDERGRGDRGRPLGHRHVPGTAPHRVRPRGADEPRGRSPRPRCVRPRPASSSRSRAWSRTASSPRPRTGRSSSTSRTRPG